jgi:hypothetical protein
MKVRVEVEFEVVGTNRSLSSNDVKEIVNRNLGAHGGEIIDIRTMTEGDTMWHSAVTGDWYVN